jgi:hypothetical protein
LIKRHRTYHAAESFRRDLNLTSLSFRRQMGIYDSRIPSTFSNLDEDLAERNDQRELYGYTRYPSEARHEAEFGEAQTTSLQSF